MMKFPSFETVLNSEVCGEAAESMLRRDKLYWEGVVQQANGRFMEALANGDEAGMDYWHNVTAFAEQRAQSQSTVAEGIAAVAALMNYGVKLGAESEKSYAERRYGEPLSARRGFHRVTDIVIDALKECGISV